MTRQVDFDRFAASYNELLRERTGFFSPEEAYFARYKVDVVRRHAAAPVRRILEYGCGIGRNLPFLRAAFPGATVAGCDISRESLEVARRENPEVECFVESPDTGLRGAPYDLVFVAGVFHHVPLPARPAVAASLLARVRPGGEVFVFEHNPLNPVTRRIVSTCPYDADAVLLRCGALRRLLAGAGLAVVSSSYCLFVPPRFPALAGREHLLGWLPLGGQYWVQARRAA